MLDLVGAAGLIPGPSSTEVALYIGYRRAGWRGLVLGGLCFILPAALMVTAIAWTCHHRGGRPGPGRLRSAGVVCAASAFARRRDDDASPLLRAGAWGAPSLTSIGAAAGAGVVAAASLGKLFLVFLKIGAIVFGSGYVLLAFLRADLVTGTHWLSESQLVDAVAVGQVTPGPVFTTATFIGYLVAGVPGAIVATLGIFLPSFVLVAASGPLIPRLRRSRLAAAFLDGVNVASLALMGVVSVQLARAALVDVPTVVLALLSGAALVRWRINSAWLVLGGGAAGAALQWLG